MGNVELCILEQKNARAYPFVCQERPKPEEAQAHINEIHMKISAAETSCRQTSKIMHMELLSRQTIVKQVKDTQTQHLENKARNKRAPDAATIFKTIEGVAKLGINVYRMIMKVDSDQKMQETLKEHQQRLDTYVNNSIDKYDKTELRISLS